VRIEKFTAAIAAKPPLATQHKNEREDHPANYCADALAAVDDRPNNPAQEV